MLKGAARIFCSSRRNKKESIEFYALVDTPKKKAQEFCVLSDAPKKMKLELCVLFDTPKRRRYVENWVFQSCRLAKIDALERWVSLTRPKGDARILCSSRCSDYQVLNHLCSWPKGGTRMVWSIRHAKKEALECCVLECCVLVNTPKMRH